MTEADKSRRLPHLLAGIGVGTALSLWLVALLVYWAMPAAASSAGPSLEVMDVILGLLVSVGGFAGLGWVLGLVSR